MDLVTRGDLPDGGHRYEFDRSVWPADPLQQHIRRTVTPPTKLVVEVDGAGLPSRVEFASNSNGHLAGLEVTMTVRDAGAAVSASPPPSGEVMPALR